MEYIYKILRDTGVKLASIYESALLLEEAAKVAQDLVAAQEAYVLVLDKNGRLQISYSSTPTPPSIETIQAADIASDCTAVFVSADGHICIPLSDNHTIYLVGSDHAPEQIEMLELLREQTAPQLRSILQYEKTANDLRHSKNKYCDLLANLQEGIWAIDADANTTFVNEKMAAMLGYSVEEMMGESMFAFMDEDGIAIANNNVARRKEGIKEQHPFKLIDKQGSPIYTLMETSPIEENGRYVGALASVMDITMRERTFRKLRYSEKRFRDLVGATNDWIWEVDAKSVYTYSNNAITNLLGYRPDDIIGIKSYELMQPKEAERVSQFLTDIVAKKIPFKDFRNVIMHKDGTAVHFLSAGAPITDSEGELLGYRGIGRDITQLLKEEKERILSHKKTDLLLSVLNGMNLAPTFQTAVEVATRLIGKHTGCVYSEAWIVASTWEDLHCSASYVDTRYQARLDSFANLSKQTTYAYGQGLPGRVWHSQQVVEYENIHLIPKDEFLRINAADKAGLKTLLAVPAVANKTTVAVLIFYTDTTPAEGSQEMALITAVVSELGFILQQKQAEDELRKLSRAVEQSATGIFITDLDARIEFVNPAFTQISGYTDAEIIGKTPAILNSGHTPQAAHHALWSTLQQGETWEGRLLNKNKDGSLVWLQNIVSPIKDKNGNTTHYISIQNDISQQVNAETALKASEAQNRALIEAIPDLMLLIDKDGVFIQSYNTDVDYLVTQEEIINRNVADILPPDIVKQTLAAIETTLRTGETSQFDYDLFLTNKDTLGHYEARFSKASTNRVLALIRDVTSEWQTTEWLRESRRKLARAQALAHLGSWEWVFATGQIIWSDEMYRISGYAPQSFEVVLEKMYKMAHPEDMEMVTNITKQTIATGHPYENEYRLQRPSGEIRYIRGRGELLTDENGEPVRLVGASLDITEQVIARQKVDQAKEMAQQTAEKLAKAQELAHLGSWEWTIASGKLIWSDETYRIYGYAPQSFELTYDKFVKMVHPEDVAMVETAIAHAVNERMLYQVKHRLQRPSGETRFVLGRAELHTDENDNPIRMVGAVLDITDQTLATQNLNKAKEIAQQATEKLEKAQELAHLGSWEWTIASGKLTWSDETYRIFGYAPQSFEITYDKFVEMVYPEDVVMVGKSITQAINARLPYQVKHRLQRPSGEIRFVLGRAELHTDENDNPIRMVGAVLDITDQTLATQNLKKATKKAEHLQQEAERANQAKSLFLTNMSHELRTPLNGILGYTQLFIQDKTLSARQLHGINVIHRSGEHLLFMINDMLDLAKIEAGKMTLSAGECDLSDMLTSLVDMVSQLAARKGIDFSHRLAAGLPQKMMTDGGRLRQILLNLLSNAVKFTNSGSVLLEVLPVKPTITFPNTNQSSMKIRFRVEDTGIGIAPELLKTIFSPFEQAGSIENKIDGTGLGLAISQQLATLLGGTLKVSSRLNKGSIFWFDLDLQIAQDSETMMENTNFTIVPISGVRGNKKLRLLIVDDIESSRHILKKHFSTLSGFEIMEAHNGKDAVTKAADFKPHVVLMDLRMPIMDGAEAARQIRLLPSFEKSIIIIAASADAYANSEEYLLDSVFDEFAVKPLNLIQLLEKIKLLLGGEWEWAYNQAEVEIGKTETGTVEIKPLPEEETAVLLDLAQTGDIKNIRKNLDIFRKNLDPQYHPTIDKLAQLTREYRIRQMRELLEEL